MLHYSMLDYPIRMKKTPSCIKQYIRSGYQKWKGKEGFQNTLTYS